jgi:hypothetical protein
MIIVTDDDEFKEDYAVNESELKGGPFSVHPNLYALYAYEQGLLLMQYADFALM